MFHRRLLWLCAGCLLACAGPASADESDRFRLSGFGTLGLARSDTDTAEFVRDLSQPRGLTRDWTGKVDSVLGLQGNFKFSEQTEGVIQVISRYRPNGSWDPEVSWAFLRHDFSPDFQVRVGRLGTEFYMLSDSRLIGYANTTVRPPPDFYGPLVFAYHDGIDITASTALGGGLLRAKLYAGHSPEETGFYDPVTWDLDGTRILGGHLDYFTGPWQFRIASAQAKFSSTELPLNYLVNLTIASDPSLAALMPLMPVDLTRLIPELSTVGKTARFDSIGVVYDKGPLQVQGMLGKITHESESYADSRAGFILASYRLGEFRPYLGYSSVKTTPSRISTVPPILPGFALNQLSQSLAAATTMDQHTVTLGTRWDFRNNLALKLQLDMVRGSSQSVFLFRGPNVQWDGRMNVLSATLDFAF